jgi:two-component system, OmpR family, KDP operon response regulator KdpE
MVKEKPLAETKDCSKSKIRILVVDDDARIRRFVCLNLTLSGYGVCEATSGEEAVTLLESEKPDIMLLDMLMPVMDGFQVLKRLRPASALPIIAFSAHVFAGEEALALGANDFLSKPFNPDELLDKIDKLLNSGRRKIGLCGDSFMPFLN